VAPSFREIRHIFNTAQVHAISEQVQLITLDADGTLYEDGGVLSEFNQINQILIQLLRANLHVAIITAGLEKEKKKLFFSEKQCTD
jgi:IMP and pyridine-specific 5'-nucleotidase